MPVSKRILWKNLFERGGLLLGLAGTLTIDTGYTDVIWEHEPDLQVLDHVREHVQATCDEQYDWAISMDLIDYIRLALFVFIAVCLVILAMNPTQEDVEDYENWIDYLDKEARERRDRDRLSSRDDD